MSLMNVADCSNDTEEKKEKQGFGTLLKSKDHFSAFQQHQTPKYTKRSKKTWRKWIMVW